jgi:hypothetical protein
MAGKCGTKGKIACGSGGLGVLFMLLAAVSKLAHFAPMGLGPRSFTAASALLLLVSINLHSCGCQSSCSTEDQPH